MIDKAYLSGAIASDGWCNDTSLGLRVKDSDFAEAFCDSLNRICGTKFKPRLYRGYWGVRTSNKTGKYHHLSNYQPQNNDECAAWLRGFFDGDGNAQLTPLPRVSENSFSRRVAMYNTDIYLLETAAKYLDKLGIGTILRSVKLGVGHLGTKPMYELTLRGGHINYTRFLELVGSSIGRKQKTLEAIPESYSLPRAAYCRKAQRKGARTKHRKTMGVTLPKVVEGIRELINQGIKPTQRNCRRIPGYGSVQRYVRQADLVAVAKGQKSEIRCRHCSIVSLLPNGWSPPCTHPQTQPEQCSASRV